MAFTSGFFNSVNHDRKYDAVQMGQIFDGIIKDGIYATYLSAMVVKESANASEVIVQPGRAWFNHVWAYNDADYPMAAPDPEVVLDRIDTLVLDVNSEDAVREAKYMWVQGTPTSQIPEPPTLIHTATHNQYPLADVYRQAGTTQIYATDITNRVGTSDCPFVTGIIETINIDSLLRQWDAEFHTWEAATKNAFEGWMLNQEDAYTLWWNSMKSQMKDDVEELEAWIETIHDILDEEVATRLQAEIDEIKTQLPSGSHITVTTTDTELFNRTVTITDEDNNTVTSTFNESGVAVFKTVPYVGTLTIESTDGIRTATNAVSTPYFARYAFNLAFWSATVNISADTELGGETCVVSNSESVTVTSIVLNAEGEGVFNATYPDTYKFSVTHGGETMEVSLAVTQETTYEVEIHAGFNWRGWLTAAGIDPTDYTDLDEVLADEEALRRLFTKHASVDYLADVTTVNADVTKILNNDYCAKWINLRDYALDKMYANAAIKAAMDTADKYGYGEWVIVDNTTTPPTWGPKGNVPVMTANTAPYGEAFGSSMADSGTPYYAPFAGYLDEGGSHVWSSQNNKVAGEYVGYKFTNPTCVKSFELNNRVISYTNTSIKDFKLQASNDGTTYVDLGTYEKNTTDASQRFTVDNDNYYLYYRIYILTNRGGSNVSTPRLQFYGRQLSVSVPVMTGNTTPYGEASVDSVYSGGGGDFLAYKAFDGAYSTSSKGWIAASKSNNNYIQYKFPSKMVLKMIGYWFDTAYCENRPIDVFNIMGSNDNGATFTDIQELNTNKTLNVMHYADIQNSDEYQLIRIKCTNNTNGNPPAITELQFFGKDYSEKEFEPGTTKKWLYDHGVELEPLEKVNSFTAGITKENDDILFDSNSSSTGNGVTTSSAIDVTNYSTMRAKMGDVIGAAIYCGIYTTKSPSWWSPTATNNYSLGNADLPNNLALPIESVNGNNYPMVVQSYPSSGSKLVELWLE